MRRADLYGNPYNGVYFCTTATHTLAPPDTPTRSVAYLEEVLGTEVIKTRVSGAVVLGSMVAANGHGMVAASPIDIPGVAISVVKSRFNALGNLVLCNDHRALVHPRLTDQVIAGIEEALDVKATRGTIAGLEVVGAAGVATSKGLIVHPRIRPEERELLETHFEMEVLPTTANSGSVLIGACMVSNESGCLPGALTRPIELGRIEDGLYYQAPVATSVGPEEA